MPGDAINSSIGALDVQFGAMDFGADSSSLDGTLSDKYNTSSTTISMGEINSNSNTSNSISSNNNSLEMESAQSTKQYNASGQMVIL